ncbi:MAG TPA: CNNM domain-containing protein, partial [Acidimicrobiia bacterium]
MTVWLFSSAALLLLLAGWLRAAGTAITRVPRADALKDASEGVSGAAKVADLLEDREVIAPAVGVVGSALLVASASFGVVAVGTGLEIKDALWRGIVVALVVFLLGDLLPRRLGRAAPRSVAYRSATALSLSVAFGGWANDLIAEPEVEDDSEEPDEYDDEVDEQE